MNDREAQILLMSFWLDQPIGWGLGSPDFTAEEVERRWQEWLRAHRRTATGERLDVVEGDKP